MSVLLSIKPKYVEEIKKRSKLFEFRKQIFKQFTDEIWVYESAPTKRIVGKLIVSDIIKDSPKNLWRQTIRVAGINKEDFFKYFEGKEEGYAIEIKDFYELESPLNPYEIEKDFVPPQSFAYMDNFLEMKEQLELA